MHTVEKAAEISLSPILRAIFDKNAAQGLFLKENGLIGTLSQSVEYVEKWIKQQDQVIEHGPMAGECVSVMKMIAIIEYGLRPIEGIGEIAMNNLPDAWDLYWELKKREVI